MNVTLIGDSIRAGYQPFVQEELVGPADVWATQASGWTSEIVLSHIEEWVVSRGADVVHINAGLHDISRLAGEDATRVSLDRYRSNVETILRTIIDKAEVRLVWATTTPVNEKWHDYGRLEADVVAYNEAAAEITERLEVEVNDLYRVVMEAGRDSLLTRDGRHFTEEGCRVLGKAVADSVRG